MGSATSWITQRLCPEEQVVWVAAKTGDAVTLREALTRLTPENRAYLEWRDPIYGYTPLANAAIGGHAGCVLALIAVGVDVNARDVKGYTPLHLATLNGRSDVVRILLEQPRIDVFARTATKGFTALDLARHEYGSAFEGGMQLVQCMEVLEKKLCVYSGWLHQRVDNLLSQVSGLPALNSWKRRYCIVLRTADRNLVELDLFNMRHGDKRPACPSLEIVFRVSDGLQETSDVMWIHHKQHRFSLSGYTKSGINRVSAPQMFEFAASSQSELVSWKTFFGSMQHGVAPSGPPVATAVSPTSDQERRDLNEAMQRSLQPAPSLPAMTAPRPIPSAPPSAPEWGVPLAMSPEPMIAPDGVEIVQPLQLHSDALPAARPQHHQDDTETKAEAGSECIICFDGPQAAVCVPCGHNAVCMNCAGELMQSTRMCPVCRVQVRDIIRLYRV
ncbi:hypothetical protein ATCC90586_008892 [Pythium insidiosum]|nr:hypothetical protein ATCC90586_008892 [Pythium insidiosum]